MEKDNAQVEIPLEELFRVRRLLEELVRFLHQPLHYQEDGKVSEWLDGGVYTELAQVFYKVTWNWLPDVEKNKIDES